MGICEAAIDHSQHRDASEFAFSECEASECETSDCETSGCTPRNPTIDVQPGEDAVLYRWFLASKRYGVPISESSKTTTFRTFERSNLCTPERTLGVGREFLVDMVVHEGGCVQYDNHRSSRTSIQLRLIR